MKTVIVVFLCIALVYSQNLPPSQNPADGTFFSSSVAGTLTFGFPVTGTIYNTTGNMYNEYWRVWAPPNVASLSFTFSTPVTGLSTSVIATISLSMGRQDLSPSYPCINSHPPGAVGNWGCLFWDHALTASAQIGGVAEQTFHAGWNYVPGHWLYATINKADNDGIPLNYTLKVDTVLLCGASEIVASWNPTTQTCIPSSSITNIISQGQLSTNTIAPGGSDYYRVNIPQNVSRVYALLVTPSESFTVWGAVGYAPRTSLISGTSSASSQNITDGTYTYFAEIQLPDFDMPVFFTVYSYAQVTYTIQFFWSSCGAYNAGLGQVLAAENGQAIFSIADCLDSVQFPDMTFASGNNSFNFQVPAYNSTIDNEASGTYGFANVAPGTVGSLTYTCNGTVPSWITINRNMPPTCESDKATWIIACSSPTNSTTLLSEDIFSGGYFSFAACHTDSSAASITLVVDRYVPVTPSTSPTPYPTASPSPNPSASSSSSARTDAGTPGKGHDNSGVIIGVVVGMVALAGVGLAFIFLRRRRNKTAEQQNDLEFSENRTSAELQQRATIGLPDEQQSERQNPKLEYLQDIEIKEVVGAGSFGQVYRGVWKGTQQVALKRLMVDQMQEVIQEATMLQKCDFPNVVKFLGLFQDQRNEVYMVTEFMSGGALNSLLEREGPSLSLKTLVEMARDAASGIRSMTDQGMVHRDLAARNLLVHKEDGGYLVKVADFGLARMVSGNYYTSSKSLFPVKWTAPESLKYEKFSVKSDVWSFGVVLWEIFELGSTPYRGMSNKETAEEVLTGYRLPKPKLCSPDSVWELIVACWSEDPVQRPTFEQIFTRLSEIINNEDLSKAIVAPPPLENSFYGNRSL